MSKNTKNTAKSFRIEFQDGRSKKNEKWISRFATDRPDCKTDGNGNVIAEDANAAVARYCPSLRKRGKVKMGKGTTAKGKTFRAIEVK